MIFGRILCWLGYHDWTSDHEESIPLERPVTLESFKKQTQLWCRRCPARYPKRIG